MRFSLVLVILAFALAACAREVATTPPRSYDRSCQADSDCTPAPSCCPAPCTGDVINYRDLQRARDALSCDPKRVCPVAGGCQTFAYLCVRNACKIAFQGDADYRKRSSE